MKAEFIKNKRFRRSDEELAFEALKYTRRVDFQHESNAYYKQAWRKGTEFLNKICSHMDKEWEIKWKTIEEVRFEALKYSDRTSFARGSSGAYDRAQRMGWLDTVCAFMGEKSNEAYSAGELKVIALKYKNQKDFREKDCGAFHAAQKSGILSDICSHMEKLWEIKWDSFEKIHKEALKYMRPGEFKKNSSGAYDAARDLGILEQVCSHMKRSQSMSLKEYELCNKIKVERPTAKKLRDSGVKIEGKPHIRRFEIDIYIPELKKGIEFDGTYYHSYEYMRGLPQKALWSDEDIRNYHQIKDSWFASKGIRILHIKEEEWDDDKENCIQKCLAFLRGENVEQAA